MIQTDIAGMVSYSQSAWSEQHLVRAVRYGAWCEVVERPVLARKMIREAGAGTGRTAEWTSGGRADMSVQQKMNWCNEPSGSLQPNPNPLQIAHHTLIIPIHGLIVPQGSAYVQSIRSASWQLMNLAWRPQNGSCSISVMKVHRFAWIIKKKLDQFHHEIDSFLD